MLKKNDNIILEITSVTHEGDGVGRHDGMAVFVPKTAPGDAVDAKVVKVLKHRAYAIINRVITPSQSRIENDCPVYRRCGGCSLRHMDYQCEMAVKSAWVEDNLRRIGGFEIETDKPLPSPTQAGYRNKAQYPVRLVNGEIRAGFFVKRTHELIPVDNCLLAPEFFGGIVNEVIRFINEFSLSAYDEVSNAGLLRHIFIRHAETSGETMLCLIVNAREMPRADALVERIRQSCPTVSTIVINENLEKTNVIFGSKTHILYGSGYITDRLCGVKIRLSAQSFYQVNRASAERLYNAALEYADFKPDKSETLLDLYCGAGAIGLSMSHKVRRVIGVEVVRQAVTDAIQNASLNNIENAEFTCADAAEAAKKLKAEGTRPDIIVVDPPRKGLDDSLPEIISELDPSRVVYISCNSATLARDAARLAALGFKLEKTRAVDLFPRTAHVECVALMTRYKAYSL